MKTPSNPQEMARVAATVRLAGELLESTGWRALHVTNDWKAGPRSANLDPDSGGWRYDTFTEDGKDVTYPVPNDTTGESALNVDRLGGDRAEIERLIDIVYGGADELVRLLRKAVPNVATLATEDMTPAQISLAGWCTSCWRDHGYYEPVAMRPNGERRYRDHCLWCGNFLAANDVLPPMELLEARHRGERISSTMVEAALAKIAEEQKKAKAERKAKRRKKKAA